MQQAALVGVVESSGYGSDDGEYLTNRQDRRKPVGHILRGVDAIDVVHRNPQLPVELTAIMNLQDVRVK